jgi:1-phosphatidylinositol-4-phosphate 5-kinase
MEAAMAKMPDEMLDEKNTIFYADDGGFRATHDNNQPGEEIYYLGIIDCLTHVRLLNLPTNITLLTRVYSTA